MVRIIATRIGSLRPPSTDRVSQGHEERSVMLSGRILALTAGLAVAACGTTAPHNARWHPNGGPPRDENWHSPAAALMKYDANHDGILTRAELLAGLKAEFEGYDTNHDNCLSADEVREINQQRVRQDASQA